MAIRKNIFQNDIFLKQVTFIGYIFDIKKFCKDKQ